MDLRSLVRTRARFQRLSDAKFFAGWIKEFTSEHVFVHCSDAPTVEKGQRFLFQVHGAQESAMFEAVLQDARTHDLQMEVVGAIRFLPPNEDMRVFVDGISARMKSKTIDIEALVMDVSSRGVGLLLQSKLERNQDVELTIHSPQGAVTCQARVKYCRPDTKRPDLYRAGVMLHDLSRIDQARWNRLLLPDAA
jgi:hypothetical protein